MNKTIKSPYTLNKYVEFNDMIFTDLRNEGEKLSNELCEIHTR